MNHDGQQLRSAAEREFLKSLDQLHETLSTDEVPETLSKTTANSSRTGDLPQAAPLIDDTEMEEAVADIEEFIKSHYPTE